MSLNYASVLAAVRTRLLANSTITDALGDGPADDGSAVYVDRAPTSIEEDGTASAYITIRLVSGTPSDEFGKNGRQYDFDVDLWYPYSRLRPPGGGVGIGPDMLATLDQIRIQLDSWVPSIPNASLTAVQHELLTTQHEDAVWHWIQSFTVWMREES